MSSTQAQSDGGSHQSSISADGRYVAFSSHATLVPGGVSEAEHVRAGSVAGTTVRASVNDAGFEGNNVSGQPAVSADGRFVAFHST